MTNRKNDNDSALSPISADGESGDSFAARFDLLMQEESNETSSVTVDLELPPAPEHEAPAHEVALAIEDITVDPVDLATAQPTTTSVYLPPQAAIDEAHRAHALQEAERLAELPRAETSSSLTADRLLESRRMKKPAPEGGFSEFLYHASLKSVNLGDSPKVRERKALDARIGRKLYGGTRFVPVLTRKGGVGKTTVTTLLGMALASVREDRVIAIDANPDRGTLAERVPKSTRATVRDVVQRAASIGGYTDFSALVSTDDTRLDVLASDTDPMLSEAFDEDDYNVVADFASRYYSIVLTDCGTGIVHSVMRAILRRADSLVIVSGGSVDEAKLASETLTWLEANGYGDIARNSVVALNTATPGTHVVKLDELENHFRSRVREVVRIPYDPQLAAGAAINFAELGPYTRQAARELAALVVEGLPEYQIL